MRRALKIVAAVAIAAAVVAGGAYALGARVYLDGGGGFHVAWSGSAASRARVVEEHREAQRTTVPASGPAAPVTAAGTDPVGAGGSGQTTPAVSPVNDWPDFRGPRRDGHYRTRPILTAWPQAGLTPLWKQPVGEGYASFVVATGRAFTIEQRGSREVVAAYDVATGRELWTNSWAGAFRETMGGDGPRATPTWADGVVFALGGEGELRALEDASGRVVWRTNILQDAGAGNLQWGVSAAPLVVDDHVVVLPGGRNGAAVVAYHRRTGARAWSALNDQASYSSPMLVTIAGERQILVFSASRLMGLSPSDGRVRWEYPWRTQYDVNASQPLLIGDTRVFISSGYGTGAAVIELTKSGDAFAVREVWRNIRMKNQFTSSVLHDGFIYGLDESILACLDAATGELKWKGGRYGYGQLILASGHLVVLTEDGDLVLVRATPAGHDERARSAAITGKTWNHPAITDGVLLVRNVREMAAFDLRAR